MGDFLGLFKLLLDKVGAMGELFSDGVEAIEEEPRYSFSYEEQLSKRSDFLALLQSRVVFMLHELLKEKDLLHSLVAPYKGLFLRIGQHFLRTLDPA